MREELIAAIAEELGIEIDPTNTSCLCRVIYSATGKMALTSLWDCPENGEAISIQHFKKRAEEMLNAYLVIEPSIKNCFLQNIKSLSEEIYNIYRRNGFFYHSKYHLTPAVPKKSGTENCILYRGIDPMKKVHMSGLGMYELSKASKDRESVANMFGLQTQSMQDFLQSILKLGEWTRIDWPRDAQFLRTKPPFSRGYWQENPDREGQVSLARYGFPRKIYVFYRYKEDCFWQKQIPEWLVNDIRCVGQPSDGEYRRIASALLYMKHKLPPITTQVKRDIVQIRLGYRLPPAEEDFFKLYSWPINYDISTSTPQVFCREMSMNVYPIFEQTLETIGYQFL